MKAQRHKHLRNELNSMERAYRRRRAEFLGRWGVCPGCKMSSAGCGTGQSPCCADCTHPRVPTS